jgi:hypothetical protein
MALIKLDSNKFKRICFLNICSTQRVAVTYLAKNGSKVAIALKTFLSLMVVILMLEKKTTLTSNDANF